MKLIAMECEGCGKLAVVSAEEADRIALERTTDPVGHHALINDPDRDWICYGYPVAVSDADRHDKIVASFQRRSIFGLPEHEPDTEAMAARGTVVEARRLDIATSVDLAVNDAKEEGRFDSLDLQSVKAEAIASANTIDRIGRK